MASRGSKSTGRESDAAALSDVVAAFGPDQRIKRAIDVVTAAVGLILFSPILLITSIAIKFDSRGPIFIRETHFGCENRAIQVFKFRSVVDRGKGNWNKPPRLTRVGQIISQTGIDELPQFLNVLRGDVSIVQMIRALRKGNPVTGKLSR
jgi:lipopolysaccharide/colanic/teichoic acid biosynthesis glycosyltransferase